MTLHRLHATAPSLKVQTVERMREYLAHHAPYVDGVTRVVCCKPYLAPRLSRYVARERTLDAFVSGMVAKCRVRERMLAAFGDFSRSANGSDKGQVHTPPGLTLARRLRRKHGLAVIFIQEFNTSQVLRAQAGTKPLEVRCGDPGPARPAALRRLRPLLAPRPATSGSPPPARPSPFRNRSSTVTASRDSEGGDGFRASPSHPRARRTRARAAPARAPRGTATTLGRPCGRPPTARLPKRKISRAGVRHRGLVALALASTERTRAERAHVTVRGAHARAHVVAMCIPIIFTCGYNNYVTDCGPSGPCSRCGQPTELYSTTTRFQFCFIPLCKEGEAAYESRCRSCGARYPVSPQVVQMPGKG